MQRDIDIKQLLTVGAIALATFLVWGAAVYLFVRRF